MCVAQTRNPFDPHTEGHSCHIQTRHPFHLRMYRPEMMGYSWSMLYVRQSSPFCFYEKHVFVAWGRNGWAFMVVVFGPDNYVPPVSPLFGAAISTL